MNHNLESKVRLLVLTPRSRVCQVYDSNTELLNYKLDYAKLGKIPQ